MNTDREDGHRDELVSATYRSLATEKSPAHLDDAVLKRAAAGARTRYSIAWAWMRPAAWAATIGLCLAIALELSQVPQVPAPVLQDVAREPVKPQAVSPPEADRDYADAIEQKREADLPGTREDLQKSIATDEMRKSDDSARELFAPDTSYLREAEVEADARSGPLDQAAPEQPAATGAMRQGPRTEGAASAVMNEAAVALEEEPVCPEVSRDTPESWLACIAGLRESGKTELADRELLLFEAEYPDFELPVPE